MWMKLAALAAIIALANAFPSKRSCIASSNSFQQKRNAADSNDILASERKSGESSSDTLLSLAGGARPLSPLQQLVRGFKARAEYDSSFTTKIAVELLVGLTTQVAAEVAKRGANSLNEIDFIIADIIMGLSANFAAVYLSAPFGGSKSTEPLSGFNQFLAACPDNAFQTVAPNAARFTVPQRIFAIIKAAPKLFGIGFGAMAVGTGLTGVLGALRLLVSGATLDTVSLDSLVHLAKISAAIGAYLAVSTNLRYQFVAGILEERLIDPLFKVRYPSTLAQGLCSGLVRTCNTFFGSAMMIDYLKLLGLQGH